ncbi:MAG: Crp/Fnr family transcriptional regulator [Fibromonadaceae bacterium]|jgi:CRP-like cAMP-binding protein|nr:Crp/Fnr family transcriptional regulator [Fibromonadaceae bacterium]
MVSKKQKNEPNVVNLLRRVGFFSNLNEKTINRFAELAVAQSFQHEETIMLAGDHRNFIFFITKGTAKIFSSSKSLKESLLGLLVEGDFFGELQMFSETGRSNISVKAERSCDIVTFKGNAFLNEISKNPELSLAFLREEILKVGRAYMQIATLSMNTTKKRVLACIIMFIEEMGMQVPNAEKGRSVIKLKLPSQQQIACMSGTSRETVNRELASLAKEGYIEINGKDLILLKELPAF